MSLKTSKLSTPPPPTLLLNGLSLFTRVDFVGTSLFTNAKPVQAAVADVENVEEEQICVCLNYVYVCVFIL